MKNDDRRSRRIALVADGVVNPGPADPDLLALIAARDWGIVALPPERLGRASIAQWMAGVADQVAEFRRHGMTVVAVLDPGETTVIGELERACTAVASQPLPVHVLSGHGSGELTDFLERRAREHDTP